MTPAACSNISDFLQIFLTNLVSNPDTDHGTGLYQVKGFQV